MTSVGQLMRKADGARFAPDLWSLLQEGTASAALRQRLTEPYFTNPRAPEPTISLPVLHDDPLTTEAERLIAEAVRLPFRSDPQPRAVRESDEAYVRHHLFPPVVVGLYGHACDAAHVLPSAQFGYDDPRNGLALCPSHHRGFDAGWFGVSDEYALVVSPRLSGDVGAYIQAGARLALPRRIEYAPAREALAWHRDNVLLV